MPKLKFFKINLIDFFPFTSWISKLKDPKNFKWDIIAGITVALVLIPQSMAYAWLAGLPIEVWLYTSFIPIMIAALFWSSHQMSTWPVTIVSLMTATAIAPIAISWTEWYVVYASLLAFFIWLFYLLLWSLKLWVIVDFLSHPVIIWFTNAVAIITITSQINKIFWVSIDKSWTYFNSIINITNSVIDNTHLITMIFGLWSIIILILLKKFLPKIPRVLIVLIISITASYYLWYNENYWWLIVKEIPNTLPSLSIPVFNKNTEFLSFKQITDLWIYAMIIWLIGFTETISVAKMAWYQTKQRVSANKELIWQWLANLSSSFFGWYWVAGSFSKTAVNLRAWASTWFSSIVTWIVVWITILFLTPILFHLPLSTLAAIIIVAVFNLIKIDPIIKAWKIEKHDTIIAITTFALTMLYAPNLEKWIVIWIMLSLAFYIYRSMRPKVIEVWMYKDWVLRDIDLFWLKESKNISVIRFDWNLYFANAGHFESEILEIISDKKNLEYLILDLSWLNNIDSSWMEVFLNLIEELKLSNIKVYLTEIRPNITEKLTKVWFFKKFPNKCIYSKTEEAIKFIEKKFWNKEVDLWTLKEYSPDKKKEPELDKNVLKKI